MATRTFYQPRASEPECIKLYGQFTIGSAGTPTGLQGNGFASVAESATGVYAVTLSDTFNKFLGAHMMMLADADATAKTALTGVSAVQTATFAAKASTTAGDHIVITDTNGNKWGISLNVAGTDPAPTGAVWAAIPAGRKVHVDISGGTTGADVAALVETAFDALTGVTAVITTADTSADLAFTHVYRAPVAAMVSYNADESSTGSTSVAETVAGVQTAVDITANSIAITGHGWNTGRSVALTISSGSLPAGLSATTYYVIRVNDNSLKLASSLANAEAGTAVDITDYGTAGQTMTLTPNAPVGSAVGSMEIATETVATSKVVTINCYDYVGNLVQPANGSKMFLEFTLRNSSVPSKGE